MDPPRQFFLVVAHRLSESFACSKMQLCMHHDAALHVEPDIHFAYGMRAYRRRLLLTDRTGIFAGDDPFALSRQWLSKAEQSEINDPNAATLATVDATGHPNARVVLIKAIEDDRFVFYTNYDSQKAREITQSGQAAMNIHWKSLRRQIRIRGSVARIGASLSDAYYASRPLGSRIGAWASKQSQPLKSKSQLVKAVALATAKHGPNPARPGHWGGFMITPYEIEFWADAPFRLHDRFRWTRPDPLNNWKITRLSP